MEKEVDFIKRNIQQELKLGLWPSAAEKQPLDAKESNLVDFIEETKKLLYNQISQSNLASIDPTSESANPEEKHRRKGNNLRPSGRTLRVPSAPAKPKTLARMLQARCPVSFYHRCPCD